jgi:hypothetical protein
MKYHTTDLLWNTCLLAMSRCRKPYPTGVLLRQYLDLFERRTLDGQ